MRLGQKSIIHFLSRIIASILGFVATIYIARLLGADALGVYSLVIALVSWLGLFGNLGISAAVTKRVSEQKEPTAYALAGIGITITFSVIVSVFMILFSGSINSYVGSPVADYLIGMLIVSLTYNMIGSILDGYHLVHISGLLGPIKTGSRAGLQIAALMAGLGLVSLFGGYILGYVIVIILGSVIIFRVFGRITIPKKEHFQQIFSFAKFSWLGSLSSHAFNWVDIAVLGFFVKSSFIGYYTASWNIAMFLILFSTSLTQTLFPEMSKVSTKKDSSSISELVNHGLSYAGLFLIPGLVGGFLLGERILRIYGSDFTQAQMVLVILILAALIQSYQIQMRNALNAIDRPELGFRVSMVFIFANVVLNIFLIYFYGWVGAAVATVFSVAISLYLSYYYLSTIIEFQIPIDEFVYQSVAAVIMGGVVLFGIQIERNHLQIGHNTGVVLSLVFVGAAVYFAVLLIISSQFRHTVNNNLPL